jgi:magnesium transporter
MKKILTAPDNLTRESDSTQLTCRVYRRGKPAESPEHLHEISEILNEPGTLVWFDVVDPGPSDLNVLQEEFDLHPLPIEDAVNAHQRPKIESYGAYWFVVMLAVSPAGDDGLTFHEIAIFAGQNYLVTVRHDPAYPLEEIEERWHAHPERLRAGGGFLLYTILDTVVDGYFPVVDQFEDRIDELEVGLFQNSPLAGEVLRRIFQMKQAATAFRRAAVPMRDILTPIIRGDVTLFSEDEIVYFRDVYDHAIRVTDQLDTLRDLLSSALDIHLSLVATRQNDVSRQLTVIATIFLPLSFLVGFFGQNFDWLVGHISGAGAFWGLGMGSELVVVFLMFLFFKRRGWF